MVIEILLLLAGIALVLWGADKFTDGSSGLARKWHVSELVIGLTIVAAGTSMPEFMVSFWGTLNGNPDMSAGNVIGSNIFNSLVILGASALLAPVDIEKSLNHRDIPLNVLVSFLFFLFVGFDSSISRTDALLLLAFFFIFLLSAYRSTVKGKPVEEQGKVDFDVHIAPYWKLALQITLGIAALILGARLMVTEGASLASQWGVSESVIGLTILAGGTSLPELATSMVAARKGSSGLAVGNVVGSNVFNIAGILGTCSLIRPMAVEQIATTDWIALIGSAVLVWIFSLTKYRVERFEGLILLLCYGIYITNLLIK